MLSKTLKYDLRSILPIWLFLSAVSFAGSLMLGTCLRNIVMNIENSYLSVFSMLGIVLSVIILGGYTIATLVFIAVRFYQNFYSDEGYLTFTLPVKRSTLYLSKIITGSIYVFATSAVILGGLTVAFLMVPLSANDATPLLFMLADEILIIMQGILNNFNIPTLIIQGIIGILISLTLSVYQVLVIYLCITVGAVFAKRWKVAAAILCYYLSNFVISLFSGIVQLLSAFFAVPVTQTLWSLPPFASGLAVAMMMLAVLSFFIILVCVIYRITVTMIEKKLNLT